MAGGGRVHCWPLSLDRPRHPRPGEVGSCDSDCPVPIRTRRTGGPVPAYLTRRCYGTGRRCFRTPPSRASDQARQSVAGRGPTQPASGTTCKPRTEPAAVLVWRTMRPNSRKSRTMTQTGTAVRPAWGSASAATGNDCCGWLILRNHSQPRRWWKPLPGSTGAFVEVGFGTGRQGSRRGEKRGVSAQGGQVGDERLGGPGFGTTS